MPILRQSVRRSQPSAGLRPRCRQESEDGFILITLLFLVALLLIGLAVAAPRMAKSIQRDNELELVHRGEQYKHAIKLYYKKFGTYPTSIDQLVNTNNIRFLRKRYTDPITGKDDWRLIHLGQAKVPPLGFFGQPLTGMPGAANVGTPVSAATGATAGGTSAFGSPSTPSTFGTVSEDTPDSTSYSDSSDSGATGEDASAHPSVTFTGTDPAQASPTPAPAGSAATPSAGSAFGATATGGTNPTFGAGPIVGVGIPSTKASLLDYKKQTRYNKWEFVYNPIEDQIEAAGMLGAGGQNVNGTSTTTSTPGTSSSPFGSSSTSPFGSSSSSSSSGGTTSPPAGSNPQ
jgi:type II secretory pathway pseudopilin PulG